MPYYLLFRSLITDRVWKGSGSLKKKKMEGTCERGHAADKRQRQGCKE